MADNVGITTGAGATIASDDVGGVHYQRIKIDLGGDGLASPLVRGAQNKANSLPVTLATDEDIAATLTSIKTAVELIDNAVGGTELQVDIVAALPAGTNAIGKLAANSGVDIGDVDVTSITAGDNVIGRVKISDGTDLLLIDASGRAHVSIGAAEVAVPVTDNAGSLTVDFSSISTGGCEFYKTIDLDESEEEVSATAATVYGMWVTNTATAVRYIKFYNATAANVIVGTTVPALTVGIPGNATDDVAGVFSVPFPGGAAFGTALTIAATTLVADNDATAPGANDVIVDLFYRN